MPQPIPAGRAVGPRLAVLGVGPDAPGDRGRFRGGAWELGREAASGERQVCLIVLDSERLPAALWRHSSQVGRMRLGGGGLAGSLSGGDLGRFDLGLGLRLGIGIGLELGLGVRSETGPRLGARSGLGPEEGGVRAKKSLTLSPIPEVRFRPRSG